MFPGWHTPGNGAASEHVAVMVRPGTIGTILRAVGKSAAVAGFYPPRGRRGKISDNSERHCNGENGPHRERFTSVRSRCDRPPGRTDGTMHKTKRKTSQAQPRLLPSTSPLRIVPPWESFRSELLAAMDAHFEMIAQTLPGALAAVRPAAPAGEIEAFHNSVGCVLKAQILASFYLTPGVTDIERCAKEFARTWLPSALPAMEVALAFLGKYEDPFINPVRGLVDVGERTATSYHAGVIKLAGLWYLGVHHAIREDVEACPDRHETREDLFAAALPGHINELWEIRPDRHAAAESFWLRIREQVEFERSVHARQLEQLPGGRIDEAGTAPMPRLSNADLEVLQIHEMFRVVGKRETQFDLAARFRTDRSVVAERERRLVDRGFLKKREITPAGTAYIQKHTSS